MIDALMTKLQCCPTSDGGAAAVIASQAFLEARPELKSQAILIAGQGMATDTPSAFNGNPASLVGGPIIRSHVPQVLKRAGIDSIHDIKLIELHDCFSAA